MPKTVQPLFVSSFPANSVTGTTNLSPANAPRAGLPPGSPAGRGAFLQATLKTHRSADERRFTAPRAFACDCQRTPFFRHFQAPLGGRMEDRRGRGGTDCCTGAALLLGGPAAARPPAREAPGRRCQAGRAAVAEQRPPGAVRGPPAAPQPREESAHGRRRREPQGRSGGRSPPQHRPGEGDRPAANGERAPRAAHARAACLPRARAGEGQEGRGPAEGSGTASAGGPGQSAARRWRASRGSSTTAAGCGPPTPRAPPASRTAAPVPALRGRPHRRGGVGGGSERKGGGQEKRERPT